MIREMTDLAKPLYKKILVILLICAVEVLWSAAVIYYRIRAGIMIPVNQASTNLTGIMIQDFLVSIVPILLFVICLVKLKSEFADKMYLRISNKKQRIITLILVAVLAGILFFALTTKTDKITILHNLIYYTVVVAFAEEFVIRDVCTYYLQNEKTIIRYIVPNLLFAAMHIFSYSGWETLTASYVMNFIQSQMLGLLVCGCLYQMLKEKTGTIWIPVLLHAIMDFSIVFSY